MKKSLFSKGLYLALKSLLKNDLNKATLKNIKKEYEAIILRAPEIGKKNVLISSYLLGAFFIALDRNNPIGPLNNSLLLEKRMKSSKLLKTFMGNAKNYFSEAHKEKLKAWAKNSKVKKYENDWVLDFIPSDGKHEFGIDYLECGVCKLCKSEGCFNLAKYLCRLDYMLVDMIGIGLDRTMTIANGDSKCDFRYYRK